MSDAADDLEDMQERGRDQPADPSRDYLLEEANKLGAVIECMSKGRMEPIDTTAAWVARLNRLARELDEAAAAIHPSAWPQQLKAAVEKYKSEAQKEP